MIIKSIIVSLLHVKQKIAILFHFYKNKKEYVEQESFYPEKEQKTKKQITKDFISHILKYGEIDETYFVLGIDVAGVNYDDYISYNQYMLRRDKLNLTQPVNYVCLLRNKSIFSALGAYWNFPVVHDVAKYNRGLLLDTKYNTIEALFKEHNHLFVKPIDAKKGEGIYAIDIFDNRIIVNGEEKDMNRVLSLVYDLSNKYELVFQDKIVQHPVLSNLHENSVNTLRIVTINHLHSSNSDDVVFVGSELRVGTGGRHTDNISAGGIKIGVKDDGGLYKFGFYRKPYGTKTTFHPDTNVVFEDYKLPFYHESISLCKEFHSKLKEIHIIGWDIALTVNGPVVIEGNDSCGTDFQVLYGPMKDFYAKYLPQI